MDRIEVLLSCPSRGEDDLVNGMSEGRMIMEEQFAYIHETFWGRQESIQQIGIMLREARLSELSAPGRRETLQTTSCDSLPMKPTTNSRSDFDRHLIPQGPAKRAQKGETPIDCTRHIVGEGPRVNNGLPTSTLSTVVIGLCT